MWSVGCLVAEMITQKAPFPGNTEMDQIECFDPSPDGDTDGTGLARLYEVAHVRLSASYTVPRAQELRSC